MMKGWDMSSNNEICSSKSHTLTEKNEILVIKMNRMIMFTPWSTPIYVRRKKERVNQEMQKECTLICTLVSPGASLGEQHSIYPISPYATNKKELTKSPMGSGGEGLSKVNRDHWFV